MMKRAWSAVLAVIMVISLLPMAWAEEETERSQESVAYTLPSAFRKDGEGIYTLMDNIYLSEPLIINEGEHWTVNLNTYEISTNTTIYEGAGTLTLVGSGITREFRYISGKLSQQITKVYEDGEITSIDKYEYSWENGAAIQVYTWTNSMGIVQIEEVTKTTDDKEIKHIITRDENGNIIENNEETVTIADDNGGYTEIMKKDANGNVTTVERSTWENVEGGRRTLESEVTTYDSEGNITEIRKINYTYTYEERGDTCVTVVTDAEGKVLYSTEHFNGKIDENKSIETHTERDSEGNVISVSETIYENDGDDHHISTTTNKDGTGNVTSIIKHEHFHDKGIQITTTTDYWRDRKGNLTKIFTTITTEQEGKTVTEEVQKNTVGEEQYRKVTTVEGGKTTWEAVGTNSDWKKVTWVGEATTSDNGQTTTHEVRTQEDYDGVVTIVEVEITDEVNGVRYESQVEMQSNVDVSIANLHSIAKSKKTNLGVAVSEVSDENAIKAIKSVANGAALQILNIDLKELGKQTLTELDTPLAIEIKTETAGKDISVYRVHGGKTEALRQTSSKNVETAADGTFYVGDGYVTIFASRFSVYAIGSSVKSGGYYYTGETGSAVGEKAVSADTFDAGIGIYAVAAVLSLAGMAWAGQKRSKR